MTSVLCAGFGPTGQAIAGAVLDDPDLELVAVVDDDAARTQESVGALEVEGDLAAALERARPDVALLTTGERLDDVERDVLAALGAGAAVITTCDQLVFAADGRAAERLRRSAADAGLAVLAIGGSAAFAIEVLPIVLSLPCSRIDSLSVRCTVSPREGSGDGAALEGSARLLAWALGIPEPRPELARSPLLDGDGVVVGVQHFARSPARDGAPALDVVLELRQDVERGTARIEIVGEPDGLFELQGEFAGPASTAAIVVSAAHRIGTAGAGLKTLLDLPPVPWEAAA